ncbi:MAG TPA: penicillin acylase family protein [Pyrinomonadaceae bacterium]|nr:penicillin acylase family protein [Pyrinomonadaceae bacterium]
MKKQTNRVWLLAVLLISSSACWAQTVAQKVDKTLSAAGLKENVIVRRDGRGIPYIEAKSEADLYFAQGFVTAQDRLWQMDLLRRVAGGETAEIFGSSVLEEDKRWRKFGFAKIAADSLPLMQPEVRAALENYARGVNAFVATLDDKTFPVEFQILQYRPREWRATDSILIGKILSDGLSSTWRQDLFKAMIPTDKRAEMFDPRSYYDVLLFGKDKEGSKSKVQSSKLGDERRGTLNFELGTALAQAEEVRKSSLERIGLYAEDLAASNNWVVSGKKTADGKPLLANDPHLNAGQPPIWYLVNLSAPNLKVAGVTFPGSPGVVLGHNENIAWGATNVGPDVQDLYLEEFDADNPLRYKTPSGFEIAQTRREEIKVRKNPLKPETETVALDVVTTRNGVVFFEDVGKRYALKWTAFDAKNNELEAFYFVNRAKNWDDFKRGFKFYGGAMQNFIYADTAGNIGWYAAGRVPIRKTGDGSLPYDGKTNDGEWTAMIPFEELPNLYNPPGGYIVTANQRTIGTSYKYHDLIARVFVPFRAARLNQLLSSKSKLTAADMGDFQYDTFSVLNSLFAKEIVREKAASEETLKLLGGWDGRMSSESEAALLVNEIRNSFRNKILTAAFGAEQLKNIGWANEGNFIERLLREKPKKWLPKEYANYAELLKASETEARANLTKRFGADKAKWVWGKAGKIRFNHPLAAAPLIGAQFAVPALPLIGSGSAAATPNVGASVSMRLIATPGNWDLTRHVIATGESGDPQSPHYKDQLDAWYSGNTPIFPFSKSAVEKAANEVVLITPK